jgi:hypothetical protein
MNANIAFGPPEPYGYVASRLKSEKPPSISRKLSTWLVSAATQATTSASPACTARAARRSAITADAPPVGMWSSQRGLNPRCCVTPTAVSGDREKLLTVRPSIWSLSSPDCCCSARSAWPRNQCAPRVE